MKKRHPTQEDLEIFCLDASAKIDFPDFEHHVSTCAECRDRLREEALLDLAMEELASTAHFCVGCGHLTTEERCANCGAAVEAGGYRVQEILASGAHGRVYKAKSPDGAIVALKELVFTHLPDLATLSRFEREAEILRQIRHPNIPRWVESFRGGQGVNTRIYIVQEFVAGASLAEESKSRRFGEHEAVRILREVLEILRYLHGLSPRIIHRDIKPSNLIRSPSGLTLVDFGAARDVAGSRSASAAGTFGYMPPEQHVGIFDESSDLYALGATVIELLTRKPPWQLIDGNSVKLVGANVSDQLQAFLQRMVALDPKKRFENAEEASRALRDLRKKRTRRRRWLPVAIAAAISISVGGFLFMNRSKPSETLAPKPIEVVPPVLERAHLLRRDAVLVPFPSGVIAAVGGRSEDGVASSVSWYDPKRSSWRVAGSFVHQRKGPAAARIGPDEVLVVGGRSKSGPSRAAEICSMSKGACRAVEPTNASHAVATANRLCDGRIFVFGRHGRAQLKISEIYDPNADSWKTTRLPYGLHSGHKAVLLDCDHVMVVAGGSKLASIYQVSSDRWTKISMKGVRRDHTLSKLENGRIIAIGGYIDNAPAARAEIYNPVTKEWSSTPPMSFPRRSAATFALENRVFVIGGYAPDGTAVETVEVFDFDRGVWESTRSTQAFGRVGHSIHQLEDGTLMMFGGMQPSGEVYLSDIAIDRTLIDLDGPSIGDDKIKAAIRRSRSPIRRCLSAHEKTGTKLGGLSMGARWGEVRMSFIVGRDGKPTNVSVVDGVNRLGGTDLARCLIAVTSAMRFAHRGPPVPLSYTVLVTPTSVKKQKAFLRADRLWYEGLRLYHQPNYEDSRRIFKACLKEYPLAKCHRELAILEGHLRQKEQALHHYREYLRLAPNAVDAEAVLSKINWKPYYIEKR